MGEKQTILFIDDESINIRLGRAMLSDLYLVDVAMNGQAAKDYLNLKVPDLILLDLHLPDMDGFEILKYIKKNRRLCNVPVIIMTADEDRDCEVEGLRLGAMDFVAKPIVPDILRERIRRVLEMDLMKKKLSTDSLTGLTLRTVGEQEIGRAMAEDSGYLAFIDVDNLKKINDTVGHEAGDRLLKAVGDILLKSSENSYSCRLGGDEFLVFLPGVSKEKVCKQVELMIDAFLQKRNEDVTLKSSSISIGLVETNPTDSYEEAFNCADKALYHVKQNGKDGYFFYKGKEEAEDEEQSFEESLSRLCGALKNSGSYHGAMNVEYREFARLYEYFLNLKKRYQHEFYLILLNLKPAPGVDLEYDLLENEMNQLEAAIRRTVRNVDVCTRYSAAEYLVILMNPGSEEDVKRIVQRILFDYSGKDDKDYISVTFTETKLE